MEHTKDTDIGHEFAFAKLLATTPVLPFTSGEREIRANAIAVLADKGMLVAPLPRAEMVDIDPMAVRGLVEAFADMGIMTLVPRHVDVSLVVFKVDRGRGFFGRRYHYATFIGMPSGEIDSTGTGKNLYRALFQVAALFTAAEDFASLAYDGQ